VGFKDSEAMVLKASLTLLDLLGFDAFRVHSGKLKTASGHFMHLAPEGTPDICARIPVSGRRLMVETKRPKGGVHSPAQQAFAAAEIAGGGVCLLVSDLDMLHAALEVLAEDPYALLALDGSRLGSATPPQYRPRRSKPKEDDHACR